MTRPCLKTIDYTKRILEIGPLANPMVKKAAGMQVFYADIRSTEAVKNFYQHDPVISVDNIVDIDYVLGSGTYSACFQGVEKFDYVLASHVLEHVPQLIAFFQDIPSVLKPQGKLCLALPDKRYCFDRFRCPTSFAECYDIYARGLSISPLRVLDFLLSSTVNDCAYWWKKPNRFDHLAQNQNRFHFAQEHYLRATNGEYIDVHFSVFTPESFLILLHSMLNSSLFPFACVEFYPTEHDTAEFNCVLEFNPSLLSDGPERQKENENLIRLLNKQSKVRLIPYLWRIVWLLLWPLRKLVRLARKLARNALKPRLSK